MAHPTDYSKRLNRVLTDSWVVSHLKKLKKSALATPADV